MDTLLNRDVSEKVGSNVNASLAFCSVIICATYRNKATNGSTAIYLPQLGVYWLLMACEIIMLYECD